MASVQIRFEEAHPYNIRGAHLCTNEDPRIHSELLRKAKRQRFKKAASICSGGEIPLLVLLPRCEEVVAVDHALQAILNAVVKTILLCELGVDGFMDLLKRQVMKPALVVEALTPFLDLIPLGLRETMAGKIERDPEQIRVLTGYTRIEDVPKFYLDNGYPVNPKFQNLGEHANTAKVWGVASKAAIRETRKKLLDGRLLFVHGDFSDLISKGPFDLFYASNARQHSPRHQKELNKKHGTSSNYIYGSDAVDVFDQMLRPGGCLLETGDPITTNIENWKSLQKHDKASTDPRPNLIMHWRYFLYQKVERPIRVAEIASVASPYILTQPV